MWTALPLNHLFFQKHNFIQSTSLTGNKAEKPPLFDNHRAKLHSLTTIVQDFVDKLRAENIFNELRANPPQPLTGFVENLLTGFVENPPYPKNFPATLT